MIVGKGRVNKIPSMLEIWLFGIPRLLLNSHSVDSLRRKNRALIYHIAAQNGQSTREKLLTFFWPDREHSAAQAILRTMKRRPELLEKVDSETKKLIGKLR